ncbi:MAG TPA: type II toxin-antitoxin system RelE/ParE family toxin [Bryobacteraceae bacterium]|nr:type II toxin-antitoxin system RelE/ParE family toxin [Bryobacteraceae bacterium]
MTIRWTPGAVADLEIISDYIAGDNPAAALRTVRAIFSRIEELKRFPLRARKGREAGTRELVLTPLPYVVAYRVAEDVVEILHVHHGARLR